MTFKVEHNELHCVEADGISHRELGVSCLKHVSIAEFAIHFWWNFLSNCEMLCPVYYIGVWDVASAHFRLRAWLVLGH